jgi:hypothetical protein
MAEHIIIESRDLPEWKFGETKNDHNVWPTLITNGCAENMLNWEESTSQWSPDEWPGEFEKLGLTCGTEQPRADGPEYPYPLDDRQQEWLHEDGDNFNDGSGAYWTYPTASLYKGRKWWAPFVEYSTLYGPDFVTELALEERPARGREQQANARKHLAAIRAAFETLPFDTMIELSEKDATWDEPLGPITDTFIEEYAGYRMYLDMDAAMNHFGTFEAYRAWMVMNLPVYIIEELPV